VQLSPHFRAAEFDCHDGTPCPRHAYPDLVALCRLYLEPLRAVYGPTTIVSGYRPPAYNRAVGGAPNSWHIYRADRQGAAADVRCARGVAQQWHALLDELGTPGLGYYSQHVHADNRAGHARW
jgi:uncharacterized protein YcbK (DUF882 family)